jgi:hypothetical protein
MRLIAAVAIVLSCAAGVAAQQKPEPKVDVDRLPIDVSKITKELKRQADVEERQGLNLRYSLHVYGVAPRLQFFREGENLTTGPVPWGAPTHQDIIDYLTPEEFRAPAADFSSFLRWLADRKKKER